MRNMISMSRRAVTALAVAFTLLAVAGVTVLTVGRADAAAIVKAGDGCKVAGQLTYVPQANGNLVLLCATTSGDTRSLKLRRVDSPACAPGTKLARVTVETLAPKTLVDKASEARDAVEAAERADLEAADALDKALSDLGKALAADPVVPGDVADALDALDSARASKRESTADLLDARAALLDAEDAVAEATGRRTLSVCVEVPPAAPKPATGTPQAAAPKHLGRTWAAPKHLVKAAPKHL